ncbi:acyloxyacyl hydrolase [Agrobacterium sp. SHOUNA12C]|nr:acyloxyacyl hydrolase [Agrobacterium sp. BETTINA12B]MCJ9759388.1 acyloxyacyl hydrolase [Agrobacterium sp. SHOUNA12C]
MIPKSVCPLWLADIRSDPCRKARPSAVSYTTPVDTIGYNPTADWKDQLTHPRIHLGTSVGTAGSATQVYGGLSWTLTHSNGIFTEVGLGGTIHTGNLDDWTEHGPMLGCRLLFHEYAGLGYNFDSHWNMMAQIAHSSHADLCDGPNGGMTRVGVLVGYKF